MATRLPLSAISMYLPTPPIRYLERSICEILCEERLQLLTAKLKAEITTIARTTETAISIQQTLHIRPTLADPQIMRSIEGVCENLGLTYTHMPSRAGHDAQEIGRLTDMGMIFVPSRAGVSHSGDEYTSPAECDRGANVLLQTFLQLDNFYLKNRSQIDV